MSHQPDPKASTSGASEKEESNPRRRRIVQYGSTTVPSLKMGKHIMEPYCTFPIYGNAKYQDLPSIYICHQCIEFFENCIDLKNHEKNCKTKHPPGTEIYKKDSISVYEIDGSIYKKYCLNLCILAKHFLEIKRKVYDPSKFYFYILTEEDASEVNIIGYFSKSRKLSIINLCCIVVLPPYQMQGYGGLLIDLSYQLTKLQGQYGTPERPFSNLGQAAYKNYWTTTLLKLSYTHQCNISVDELSKESGIAPGDILDTLKPMDLIEVRQNPANINSGQKYKEMFVKKFAIEQYSSVFKKHELKRFIDRACLKWQPKICDLA